MSTLPTRKQRIINHFALVIDASSSMHGLRNDVIKVADAEIAHWAKRSVELKQETRVSVYTFSWASNIQCVIFDMDVLRLPSIAEFYEVNGMTALRDATLRSQVDLAKTAQMYDDHAFLTYVITDGEENNSNASAALMADHLARAGENWTVGCLVPDERGKGQAMRHGFPEGNIAIWDVSKDGLNKAFTSTIRTATESFFTGRAEGRRGSRSLFTVGGDVDKKAVNEAVKKSDLQHILRTKYYLYKVQEECPIRPFVEGKTKKPYAKGLAYYELIKPETIQVSKKIAVRNKITGRVYMGDAARKLLNLPDYNVRVKPEDNQGFEIFVQSTSVNRKLVPNQQLLVMKS